MQPLCLWGRKEDKQGWSKPYNRGGCGPGRPGEGDGKREGSHGEERSASKHCWRPHSVLPADASVPLGCERFSQCQAPAPSEPDDVGHQLSPPSVSISSLPHFLFAPSLIKFYSGQPHVVHHLWNQTDLKSIHIKVWMTNGGDTWEHLHLPGFKALSFGWLWKNHFP